MKLEHDDTETAALRAYTEAVARQLGVGPSAAWAEYGPPSTAYVALDDRSPAHPARLVMLQWSSEHGWSLALEPERTEPVEVLAAWPDRVSPPPPELAAKVRQALRNASPSRRRVGQPTS